MAVRLWPIQPPVQDSAVARVSPRASKAAPTRAARASSWDWLGAALEEDGGMGLSEQTFGQGQGEDRVARGHHVVHHHPETVFHLPVKVAGWLGLGNVVEAEEAESA